MVARVEPAVVGMAEAIEFADVYHAGKVAVCAKPSSVSVVTG
jgi:hypothetical protein